MAVDGRPLRIAYGCLGDIGHVIVERDGPLCACGGRGCAEVMVSAPVLAQRYQKLAGLGKASGLRQVIEAATAGDDCAIQILREAGEWLGIAIASMSNILFPDHIAVAGGLSIAGSFVLGPAERMFQQTASIAARSRTKVVEAALGPHASLIGAASPFWQ
jgi:glucokinase